MYEVVKNFKMSEENDQRVYVLHSEQEEAAYDIVAERNLQHPLGRFASILNIVKGALGSGILGGHVVFKKAGYLVALITASILGCYVSYSIYTIVACAQIIYKRGHIHTLSYPDLGEAALSLSQNPTAQRYAKFMKLLIVICIALDLFGACCSYQVIMASTIKQLVEDKQSVDNDAHGSYPRIQVYLAGIWLPCVLLSFVKRFSVLAKISLVGNFIVLLCMGTTLYYFFIMNPSFKGLKPVGNFPGFFELCGVTTFSMSAVGAVLPAENHLRNTYDYKCVHFTSFILIVSMILMTSFFGYAAFLEESKAPVTVNFPMEIFPKILKVLIFFMVLTTHALNFWIPFQLVWVYARKRHLRSKYLNYWEMIYKTVIVTCITLLAILFPDVTAIMGLLGTLLLSLLIFILPNVIEIYVYLPRPGFGPGKWRLYKCFILILGGLFICVSGSYFTGAELIRVLIKTFSKKNTTSS